MTQLVYVLIAVLTFCLGIIATLCAFIFTNLNTRVNDNARLLADSHDDLKDVKGAVNMMRAGLADHLRSSRRLQGEYDKMLKAIDRRLTNGGH